MTAPTESAAAPVSATSAAGALPLSGAAASTLAVPFGDVLLPVLLPLGITLLQALLWDVLYPYVWLAYVPVVAVVTWLCGLGGGLFAITLSLACAEGLFLALGDQSSLTPADSRVLSAGLFTLLSVVPVWLLQRFRSERAALNEALASLRMRALIYSNPAEDDGSNLTLLRRLREELLAREHALAANPFPLALFGADGRCQYAAPAFADHLGLPFSAVLRLNLLGDESFPVAGVPAAAAQLLQGRSGERTLLSVSDGNRRCQVRLLTDMPSPSIMLSLHEDGLLPYTGSQRELNRQPAAAPARATPPVAGAVPAAPAPDLPQPAPQPASAGQPDAPTLTGLRCLVVDDHQINRQLMSELLGLEGVQVTLANNGLQAVSVVQANPDGFDVVLMDLQMPGLDGYGASRQIRAMVPAHRLPIFAVTADGAGVDRSRLHGAGMQDLLHKPIDQVALLGALQSLPRRPAQG